MMITDKRIQELKKKQYESSPVWSEENKNDLLKCVENGLTARTIYMSGIFRNRTFYAIEKKIQRLKDEELFKKEIQK